MAAERCAYPPSCSKRFFVQYTSHFLFFSRKLFCFVKMFPMYCSNAQRCVSCFLASFFLSLFMFYLKKTEYH